MPQLCVPLRLEDRLPEAALFSSDVFAFLQGSSKLQASDLCLRYQHLRVGESLLSLVAELAHLPLHLLLVYCLLQFLLIWDLLLLSAFSIRRKGIHLQYGWIAWRDICHGRSANFTCLWPCEVRGISSRFEQNALVSTVALLRPMQMLSKLQSCKRDRESSWSIMIHHDLNDVESLHIKIWQTESGAINA